MYLTKQDIRKMYTGPIVETGRDLIIYSNKGIHTYRESSQEPGRYMLYSFWATIKPSDTESMDFSETIAKLKELGVWKE